MRLQVFGVSFRNHAIYFKILVLQGFKKIIAVIISEKSLKMWSKYSLKEWGGTQDKPNHKTKSIILLVAWVMIFACLPTQY